MIKRTIPYGFYCYDKVGTCPHWSMKDELPVQENGYCSLLGKSDWDRNEEHGDIKWQNETGEITRITKPHEMPLSLLWDMCKECEERP